MHDVTYHRKIDFIRMSILFNYFASMDTVSAVYKGQDLSNVHVHHALYMYIPTYEHEHDGVAKGPTDCK